MPRQVDIPAQVVFEKIIFVEELPNFWVRASVGKTDASGDLIPNQRSETYTIEGDNFTELLSPAPSWSPNKPAGTYDNEDLWHFIDILRNTNA